MEILNNYFFVYFVFFKNFSHSKSLIEVSMKSFLLCRTTRTLWRVGGCSFSWWSDHIHIEVIVDISNTRWSYSDTVAKMTRRWDFPLRKSSFLIGLRWDQTLSSIMSNFDQIYPPESRSEESKLQSRLLQKLGLHSIQCSLWNLNHLHRRWRDPLYPWVPRPRS